MSSFVKNLYPERLRKMSVIIGNGYCLHLMTLFNWSKLLILMSTKYMYIDEDLGWVLVNSATAAKKICQILGFYAPVNYMTSAISSSAVS